MSPDNTPSIGRAWLWLRFLKSLLGRVFPVARPEDIRVLFLDESGEPFPGIVLLGPTGSDIHPDSRGVLCLPGALAGRTFTLLESRSRRHLMSWTAPRGGELILVEVSR